MPLTSSTRRLASHLLLMVTAAMMLPGCAVVSVAGAAAGAAITVTGAAAGAAISVGGAVVSTGVSLTGKVVEKTIDLATAPAD